MAKPHFAKPTKQLTMERLFSKARTFYEQKKDEQACEALHDVLKLEPDHLFANKMLATVRSGMGHHEQAKFHWAKAVLQEPQEASNFYNFGQTLQKLGELDDALA
jgi:Tfp pilus assembly protein PilF